MKKLTLNLILLLTLLFFAGCKNEDGENANIIKVTYPTSTSNWHSGESGTYIEWSGATGTSIDCDIYQGDTYLGPYVTGVNNADSDNDGVYTYRNQTPLDDFETGSDYRLKIKDNEGNYGWSSYFTITDRNDNINIQINTASTLIWAPGQLNVGVTWDIDTAAQGDSVSLHVYHGDSYVDIFSDDMMLVPNTGSYTKTSPVPVSWNTRDQYTLRVKITSTNGTQDYGFSEYVMVQEKQPEIMITMPNSSSVFLREEPAEVRWESATAPVTVYLYEGLYAEPINLGTSNDFPDGSMNIVFDESWNNSLYYLFKIEDDNGEFGWSSYFPIGNIPTEGLLADYTVQNNEFVDLISNTTCTVSQEYTTDREDRFGNANSSLYNNIIDDNNNASYVTLNIAAALLDTLTVGEDAVTFAAWFKTDWRPEGEDEVAVIYSVCSDSLVDNLIGHDVYHHMIGITEEGAIILADNLYNSETNDGITRYKNEMLTGVWGSGYNDDEWHLIIVTLEADGARKAWISNNGETYDGFDYYYLVSRELRWDIVNNVSLGMGQSFTQPVQFGSYNYNNFHGDLSQIKIFNNAFDDFNAIMLYHVNNYDE